MRHAAAAAVAGLALCAAPAGAAELGELAAFSHRDGCAAAREFAAGELQPPRGGRCRPMTRQQQVAALVPSPDGRRLYAIDTGTESVVAYRTLSGGGLRELTGEGSCAPLTGARIGCRLAEGVEDRHSGAAAISPDGRQLYVASIVGPTYSDRSRPVTGIVDVFSTTGGLARIGCVSSDGSDGHGAQACTRVRGLTAPSKLLLSPDGNSLLAVSESAAGPSSPPIEEGVAVLRRDADSGSLTQAEGPPGCVTRSGAGGECAAEPAFEGLSELTLSPSGAVAYASARTDRSGGVFVLRRDPATGALAAATGPGTCAGGLASRPDCAADSALQTTGLLTVSPDGRRLYAGTDSELVVLSADEATQTIARSGCISDGFPKKCARVRTDPAFGRLVFAADGRTALLQTDDAIETLDLDPGGSAVTSRGCIAAEQHAECSWPAPELALFNLAIAPSGRVAYAAEFRTVYTLAPGAALEAPASVRLAGDTLALSVRCHAATRCSGTIALENFLETLRIPATRLSVPAGAKRTVRVRVPASVQRAVARHRRLNFDVTTRIALGGRQGLVSVRRILIESGRPAVRPTCRGGGVRTLARTSRMRVYTVRTPADQDFGEGFVSETTYGCLFSAGRQVALDEPDLWFAWGPFVNAGSLLAYDHELTSEGESDAASFVRVLDLRTGAERREFCAYGPGGCGFDSSDSEVHAIVLLANGAVAWTAESGGDRVVMKADAGAKRAQVLDATYGRIGLKSLRLRGNRLTWTHSGKTRSATLR
jgi:hypothetical protein